MFYRVENQEECEKYGWMDGWIDGWIDGWKGGCTCKGG